jgi:hypothetical protein
VSSQQTIHRWFRNRPYLDRANILAQLGGIYNALASAGEREMHNVFRYDRRRQKWEDSRKDPEDILRQAEAYRAAKGKTKARQR